MYKLFAIVLTVCLFCLIQKTSAYCCFRDPWMMPCGCSDMGVDTCGMITCNPYSSISSSCNCGVPSASCFRDTSNVCFVCDNPSPICSCLKSIGECGSKGVTCGSTGGSCGSKGGECGSTGGSCGSKGGECGSTGGSCGSKGGECGSTGGSCGSKCGGCGSTGGSCGSKDGECGSTGGACGSKGGDCGKMAGCGCGIEKSFIYFPEVEYPMIALEMKPFYYGSCYGV